MSGQVDYVALSRDLVDAVESGVYIIQSKKFVYVNPFFAKLTGYSREELIGTRYSKFVLPQDRPAVRKKAIRNLKSRVGSRPYEYRFIKKNGEIMWVMERVSPIGYMGQKAALGSFVDITERKRLEEALAHSEKTYRTILERMYDSYYEVDLAGNFTFVNDSVCLNLGYSREEMVGQSYRFTTPPDDIKPLFIAFNQVFNTGIPNIGFAHGILRKDGSIILVESSISVRENEQGEIIGFRSVSRDITERKQLEEALVRSEERYRTILEQMQDSYYEVDLAGNYTFVSESAGHSLGYSREELIGKNYRISAIEEDTRSVFAAFNEVYRTGKPNKGFAYRIRHKDGRIIFSEVSVDLKRNEQGEVSGFKCVNRDVTERKRVENALKESEEQFRTALENAPDGVFMFDLEGTFRYSNHECEEITGYKREELIGKNFLELNIIPENSLTMAAELFQDTINDKPTGSAELELIRKDGLRVPVEINGSVVQYGGQAVMLGFARDITQRKEEAERLRQSEEQYRLLSEHTTDTIWLMDMNLKTTYQSPSAEKLRGYTPQEILDLPLDKHMTPESLKLAFDVLAEELPRVEADPGYNPIHTLNLELYCKDGTTVWAETKFSIIRDPGGKPVSMLAEARNITDRKKAEEALKESEDKYRSLVENINDILFALDTRGKITYVSPIVERLSKYKVSDLIGKPLTQLIYPDDLPALLDSFTSLLSGQLEPWEFRVLDKDGRVIFVRTSSRPVYKDEEVVGITTLMTDITERKKLEQKLVEMATHDFLTGLPNRLLLIDRFNIVAALAHRNKARLAVMSLDLDEFKTINDTLGHDAGDQVLKAVSTRLTGIIRASDTVARVGGDEFILLMLETKHMEDATAIAQKILDSFIEPFSIDGHQLHLTTSIGIAIYPEDAEDMETLIKKSDAMMYYSKGHGGNQFRFFSDGDVRVSGDHKSAP